MKYDTNSTWTRDVNENFYFHQEKRKEEKTEIPLPPIFYLFFL